MYSSAKIILLDDILSALDVHTSHWIVSQCLAGELLKGRTVLLVTHNVLLASTVADYMVVLNADGTLKSQGPVERLLDGDIVKVAAVDTEEAEKEEEAAEEESRRQKGKQIVAEEVAIGHIGWPVCK